MNLVEIKSQLVATAQERDAIDTRLALLALLALATMTRNEHPDAAYVSLAETDQNDSGELWVQGVCDANQETIADSQYFDDETPIAYHLHGGNEAVWNPFVADVSGSGRSAAGEYLLDIAKVLDTLPLEAVDYFEDETTTPEGPNVFRMLDASTAHLPQELREELGQQPGVIADERGYGWLLWVPENIDEHVAETVDEEDEDNEEYGVPAAVVALWRKAAEHDCKYVLLDSDARLLDLPTYD